MQSVIYGLFLFQDDESSKYGGISTEQGIFEVVEQIRLTSLSKGSGCGCKVDPSKLRNIIDGVVTGPSADLIVGNESGDDASVHRLSDHLAIIASADFFTPLVDDPFLFGRIAAANSISDVYAMGGKPIMALGLMGWPVEKVATELAAQVMHGASSLCAELGLPLSGGHTIDAPEPFFGLSVNGIIHPHHIKRNHTAKEGDLLFLTKPIGTGILGAAVKRGMDVQQYVPQWELNLQKVNKIGYEIGLLDFVHAMTDLTGFGFMGHVYEMMDKGRLAVEVDYPNIPLLPGADELATAMVYTDNTMRNWSAFSAYVEGITGNALLTLCDPQTNGGLLVAVSPHYGVEFARFLEENGMSAHVAPIGRFVAPDAPGEGKIIINS